MQRFQHAIESAQNWINSIVLLSAEPSALAAECATLIRTIQHPEPPTLSTGYEKSFDFITVIEATRDEILRISSTLAEHDLSASYDSGLAALYLAESFARSDDLQAVAVMLALCERVIVDRYYLAEIWEFVLNQQGSDGSFGLISAELSMLGRADDQLIAKLTLTRDVLRAIRARYQFGGQPNAA